MGLTLASTLTANPMLETLQTLALDMDPMNTKFTPTKEVMAAPPVPMDNRPKVQVECQSCSADDQRSVYSTEKKRFLQSHPGPKA
jgi:hypothetical protein